MVNRFTPAPGEDAVLFVLRWRGRQEGPYTGEAIDAKLAANEIGLAHEVYYEGKWITLREFLVVRETARQAERCQREEQGRRAQDEAERQAHDREVQLQAEARARERQKQEMLAAGLARAAAVPVPASPPPRALQPDRGGLIITLAIVGLFVFGGLCIAAWIMASVDLKQMNEGKMNDGGRFTTSLGRVIGVLGTVVWVVAVCLILVLAR